nr:hypothetical protein [Tanacetum cinerariifolium]
MVEHEKPLKKKDQISLDEEVARKFKAEMKAEMDKEEMIAKEKNEANRAIIEEWDDVQATINVDRQRKYFAAKRAEEIRNKPPTKAHQKSLICTYMKNMDGFKKKDFKGKSFDDIKKMFDKKLVEQEQAKVADDDTTELKRCIEIVSEDDDDVEIKATPLSSKSPTVVDYNIYRERKKSYFRIIKYNKEYGVLSPGWEDVPIYKQYTTSIMVRCEAPGRGPKWVFDVDSLTISMNYEPVTTRNQTNNDEGIEINANAGKARQEKASNHEYILISFMPSNTQSLDDKDAGDVPDKGDECLNMRWFGYGHLEKIVVRTDDNAIYKFKEGDFLRLNLRIVILHRVEDLQLGFKSYQKKLTIARLETTRSNISKLTSYTAYKNHQGIIYLDKYKRNRLMRSDELYKFYDEMLSSVRQVLHDIVSNLEMDYLPKRHWSNLEIKRSRIMVKVIDKLLFERRLMRNLEKFVGGRDYRNDLRLLERTI